MTLGITQEEFECMLPFVGAATEDVFAQFCGALDMATDDLLQNVVVEEARFNNNSVRVFAVQWVVNEVMLQKLRSRDLVLTDSGFGVVSTQNVAPASRERVDALEKELEWLRDGAMEHLILLCRDEQWAETTAAMACIPSLLWRPADLKRYAHSVLVNERTGRVERATFGHVQSCTASINAVMDRFGHHYSTELADALLHEERVGSARTYSRERVVNLLRQMMGQAIEGFSYLADLTFNQIGKTIERHLDEFPEYENSEEYGVNHGERYENTLRTKAYFF